MAVGDVTQLTITKATDPLTGATVEQLTDGTVRTWYPYFTQPVLAGDQMLVQRDTANGLQCFLLEPATGRLVQVTDLAGGVGANTPSLLPGQEVLYCFQSTVLYRVDLTTLAADRVCDLPAGYRPSIISPSGDGATLTFAACEWFPAATATGVQYSDFYERLYRRPNSILYRVETGTGKPSVIWGEDEWISHVNVSPTDGNLVVFCHEGPWDRVQRLWVVRASSGETWPLLDHGRYVSRSGHEVFLDDGRLLVQFSRRMTSTAKDWIHYNVVLDLFEHDVHYYRFPAGMPTHIQGSHAGDRFVGDACGLPELGPDGRRSLTMIDHGDDELCHLTPLCRHDTSWKTQPSHPHPIFALDDRSIFYNSDRTGVAAVYRVAVPD